MGRHGSRRSVQWSRPLPERPPPTGSFRLAFGHAARPAFYFVVSAPGTVTVRVDATVAEPVSVTLYTGQTAIERA